MTADGSFERAVEAFRTLESGSVIAVGGYLDQNVPVALLCALAQAGVRDLTVVAAPSAGLGVDLLISAGAVAKVVCPYVGFEGRGAPPALVRAVERGTLKRVLCDQQLLMGGLRAASFGLPFVPIHRTGADIENESPLAATVGNPFGEGEEVYCARSIAIDATLVHAQSHDASGNLVYEGSQFMDHLMLTAGRRGFASTDSGPLVDAEGSHRGSHIPSIWTEQVWTFPAGACPTASHGRYGVRADILDAYLSKEREASGGGFEYLWSVIQGSGGGSS